MCIREWLKRSQKINNDDNSKEDTSSLSTKAFGRVVQINSFAPIIALQLFVSQGAYFDMERLISSWLSQSTSNFGARNMASFSMKYYYLDLPGSEVYLGQDTGKFHEKEHDTRICRGSSLVTVRFVDGGLDNYPSSSPIHSPWRLLIFSCGRKSPKRRPELRNGIEAYFWGINEELTGVRRSLRHVADKISSVAVPSVSAVPIEQTAITAVG